jgi:hypothetical protein
MREFTREIVADKPRDALAADAVQAMTLPLARHGYKLDSQTDGVLTYVHTYRHWLCWTAAVFLFPLGLLTLLIVERAYITITFQQQGDTTTMRIAGEGTKKVRRAFEQLSV